MRSSKKSSSVPTTDGIKFTYSFRDLSVTWALRWRNGLVPHFCRQHGWDVGLTRPSSDAHSWWNGEMQSGEHSYTNTEDRGRCTTLHDLGGRCPWSH
jgi:hypothetical protein